MIGITTVGEGNVTRERSRGGREKGRVHKEQVNDGGLHVSSVMPHRGERGVSDNKEEGIKPLLETVTTGRESSPWKGP